MPGLPGPLEVIDTWERSCSNPGCDYVFNLYHWPHVFAPFDPEQGIAPDPMADLTHPNSGVQALDGPPQWSSVTRSSGLKDAIASWPMGMGLRKDTGESLLAQTEV